MVYQISALLLLTAFYTLYITKIIIQKRQSIKTNQLGVGNKPKHIIVKERILCCATVLTLLLETGSVFVVERFPINGIRTLGIAVGILGVIFFAAAVITMKTSWRVGIPEEKTFLITDGIYKWSRNPAYVGFDFLYLSICLIFFNIPLMLVSVWAAVMLHFQILQEEVHLYRMFGDEYEAYMKHTLRYFGKNIRFHKKGAGRV